MRSIQNDVRGFTLIELMVVLLLATVTTSAAMAVFVSSNRVHIAQTAQMQLQQTARAGTDVLSAELREISNGGGDILAIGPDSISIRRMGQWTMVCDVDYPNSRLNVLTIGNDLATNDSIFLFAENDTLRVEDDVWLVGTVDGVTSSITCVSTPTAWAAHQIDVSGLSSAMAVDTVRRGAPLRTFTHYTYGSYTIGGEVYVGRRDAGGTVTPLVGPIKSGGLVFTFRDEFENVTTTLTDIAQVDVSLAMESPILDSNNNQVQDSVFTTVFLRN